jgi:conjugal transfer pilus assembly protein TraD
MRWWDRGVRIRVALISLNAAGLAIVSSGGLRLAASLLAVAAVMLLVRSWRSGATPKDSPLDAIPSSPGAVYLGQGFEWTLEAVQETVESGNPARRTERPLFLPETLLNQHLLVFGTTGIGKTRLLELLALQAIARGDPVIVIDPKGDSRLRDRLRLAADARFRLFSLPHPKRSVRYNPLGRYDDVREVADRVAALLPSSGDALPFRNFGWDIIHTVVRELHGKRPITFQTLKRAAIDQPIKPLSDRPRDHYLKTASGLIPILSKLSIDLLCPKEGGLSWDDVVDRREVVYFELGSLLAGESASAVARTTLLDLQSFVGARYAHAKTRETIWLFVDELADAVTTEFVGLLGKSRGAGLRIVACGQTTADLEAALGSRARALQVLGNANTMIQMRCQNSADAELFAGLSGDRLLRLHSEGASYEPALLGSGLRTVDDYRAKFSDSTSYREHPMVPPWLLSRLERGRFYARIDGKIFQGRVPLLR